MREPGTRRILVLYNGQDSWTPIAEADELCRKRLAVPIPDDFPKLDMPAADGEPMAAYVERAIARHPLIVAITSLDVLLEPMRPQLWLRPKQLTYANWKEGWPAERGDPREDREWLSSLLLPSPRVLRYQHKRWAMRLMVELFDCLRAGDLTVQGLRRDDPDQVPKPVHRGLWQHPDMMLELGTGWFRPEAPRGQPAPPDKLPAYYSLTLHARAANVPPSPNRTRLLTSEDRQARVDAWMHEWAADFLAKNGRPPFRDKEALPAAQENGFAVHSARNAYKRLPPHLKNPARKPKQPKAK